MESIREKITREACEALCDAEGMSTAGQAQVVVDRIYQLNGAVYVADPPRSRLTGTLEEKVVTLITSYNPEWDDPRAVARRIIKLARK